MQNASPDKQALQPGTTFVPGRDHKDMLGYHADLSANPNDLRPAVDIIMKAIDNRRAEVGAAVPIVVEMGETHDEPTTVALQQLLAARLNERGDDFTFNFERPHNWGNVVARHSLKMAKDFPDELYQSPSAKYDPKGTALLTSYMGAGEGITHAPISHDNLKAFLLDHEIPTAFNDAAIWGKGLDSDDPTFRAVAEGRDASQISNMLAIRNSVMAKLGVEYGNELIIQSAGGRHLFDDQNGVTLSEAYKSAGASVIPVLITVEKDDFGINTVPARHQSDLMRTVVIDGIGENPYHMGQEEDERKYLAEISRNSGNELEVYDVDGNRERYLHDAHQKWDRVVERYEDSLDI